MSKFSISDPARLRATLATSLVDSEPTESFDQFTRLARQVTGAGMAFISLILEDRQYFKSAQGLTGSMGEERGTPIHLSLCRCVVENGTLLVIRDGPNDSVYSNHPGVTELGLHAYIGVPLIDDENQAIGSFCIAEPFPRNWTEADIEAVTTLAHAVRNEILLQQSESARLNAASESYAKHELLDKILETTVGAVTVLDLDGSIVFCNQRAESILGLKRSQLHTRRYDSPEWHSTALDGGPWSEENQPFFRVLQTGEPVYDVRHAIVWPDGTRHYLSINGAPIRNEAGEISQLVFLINDISESYLASQSLTRVAEQFAKAFCISSHFAVLCHRSSGAIIEVSEGFVLSLKRPRESCIGRTIKELEIDFPNELLELLFSTTGEFSPAEEIELRLKATDGLLCLLKIRAEKIQVATEEYLLIAGQDLTFQRAQELQQASLERQLREAQKVELVGQLAGGLAHDFNNILTAIIGNSELISQILPKTHEAQRSVALINKAGKRAAEQIRQILAFSRKERSEITIVNIGAVIEETVQLFRSNIAPGISINVSLPSEPPFVSANESQLHQILMNLLTNAGHAVGDHGNINVRVTDHVPADLDDFDPTESVLLEVEDDGLGIDPVHLSLVFDPFFTTKKSGSGTGIGLALARTLARSFDGELTVQSQLGLGATFRLFLPRASKRDLNASITQDPFGERYRNNGVKILFVDDDAEVLLTGRMVFEQLGHQVESTSDPEAALASLTSQPTKFDLLITDNLMPKLTGVQLIDTLRERNVLIPAILVSGYGATSTQIENLATSRATFVAKPFSISELAKAIKTTLTTWGS